jgi:hypothetical protein
MKGQEKIKIKLNSKSVWNKNVGGAANASYMSNVH